MREYRFHVLDEDGHIKGPATDPALPDDPAALEKARVLGTSRRVEIWQGPRFVAYVVPDQPA